MSEVRSHGQHEVGAEEAPSTDEEGHAGTDPTVGTGSIVAVGCVVFVLVAMAVLAVVFFLPFVGR